MAKARSHRTPQSLALRTHSLVFRPSLVEVGDFGRPVRTEDGLAGFFDSLPNILAGKDFKAFLRVMRAARSKRKVILFGLGAHVIKVGLSPVLVDLMKEGWVSGIALNGAGIIHDFEIAFCGRTSEDVATQIQKGEFGMARETAEMLNGAIRKGARQRKGLGAAVGEMLSGSRFPFKNFSLLANAHELGIPVSVHVAIGTDTIHFHPQACGPALGQTSLNDFFLFCSLLKKLEGGGVYLNIGSAVVLPEVFLKGVSYVRNLGTPLDHFFTAVFDFQHQYRPEQNVVRRALGKKGRGFYFIGHHEIMVPLLAAGLRA